MRYPTLTDGDLIEPKRRGYKMMCCDCGLVHRFDFWLVKRRAGRVILQFTARRDNRATAAARRKRQAKR